MPPRPATRKLASLSVAEVCGLLPALDLGKYAAAFRAFPVNGSQLGVAADEDLEEVGVASGMHRRALLQRVQQFLEDGVPLTLLADGAKRVAEAAAEAEELS
ncbi:hypothetical protein T484DRAFT_1850640, partial [Baffinella frigidus]